ncbi:MAG: hypothetical protein JKY52_14995 [Flavobacteriales bacterium]|nr:hypothetical protein [Flavobacteriales bacterium]
MSKFTSSPSLILAFLLFAFGCSYDAPEEEGIDYYKTVNIADSLGLNNGEATVFLLPAPLQVVTALKLHEVPYSALLISDIEEHKGNDVEYKNALNLGINTIDMGYATVNGDLQLGLSYSQNVKALMEELGITSAVTGNMIERIEANGTNQDSLSKIILEAYGASHAFFQSNQREGMGLLILTGCFIEGLYLTSSADQLSSNSQVQSLLGIHKEYLENLLLLIGFYNHNEEVSTLIDDLKQLKDEFYSVDLAVNIEKGSAKLNSPVSEIKIASIRSKIIAIRNRIRA